MVEEVTAVKCKQCGKLHSKRGIYILIEEATIRSIGRRHPQSVALKDVIVCDDKCLTNLVTLGF